MENQKLFKQASIGLVAGVLLFGAVAPVGVAYADGQQTPKIAETQHQISQAFINKFNNAVQLKNGQFVIIKSLLPKDTSVKDLQLLNQLIFSNNVQLKTMLSQSPKANVVQTGNSIVVGENKQVAQQVAQNLPSLERSLFHEGSNYVHSYWWGFRIGLSKTTLNYFGGAMAMGGIWIPHVLVSKIVSTLGVALGFAPGGIVFNITPGLSNFWGQSFQ